MITSITRAILTSAAAAVLLGVSAPALALKDSKISAKLPPMAQPELPPVGRQTHTLWNGKEQVNTVTEVGSERVSGESSDGCKYSYIPGLFAPSVSWTNCDGHTGTREILDRKGDIWPLQTGRKFSYRTSGKDANRGDTWKRSYKCKVDERRIEVAAGEFDAYRVECSSSDDKRRWWVSPELGVPVAGERVRRGGGGGGFEWELVKIVDP